MNNEIEEIAKAGQEIAKTISKGIEATEKLGGFLAKYVNEPFEAITGMISDKLHYVRWKRQLRLLDQAKERIKERGLENNFRIVPPKLALPIIENASLEEDDELQDLWANLLVSALDPNFDGTLRTAFIDILKQLEVIDVHILNFIYSKYPLHRNYVTSIKTMPTFHRFSQSSPVSGFDITKNLNITSDIYEASIDNLIRVRCIASYIQNKEVAKADYNMPNQAKYNEIVSFDYQYEQVCLTSLGVNFIEACISQKKDNS